jgi:hypothetical protein
MSLLNDVVVKFKNQPELHIQLDDNPTASAWLELFKENYQRKFPLFRDQKKYTLQYLRELALQAKTNLNWDCETEFVSIDDTVKLHKCLETTLALGFNSIPAIYDNLIHELHFCLHKIEYIDFENTSISRKWLQMEWFNNDGFNLDTKFKHKIDLQFGHIRLQNPFVGHIPLQIFDQNDTHNIMQTCKFHNFVRPGLYIHTTHETRTFDEIHYTNWWESNAPEFVKLHGMKKILDYTGHPIIGQVTNLNALETVVNSNDILELEYVFTK